MKKIYLFLITLSLTFQGCVHIEPMHFGVIKDAETQKPLANAIVHLDLRYACYLAPYGAFTLGQIETTTNDNGRYSLSPGIFFMPPLLCRSGDKRFIYTKLGYFTNHDPSDTYGNYTHEDQTNLVPMHHYLNYPRHKHSEKFSLSDTFSMLGFESQLMLSQLEKFEHVKLEPIDEIGVFLRLPGRKLTRLLARTTSYIPGDIIFYAYDSNAKEWVTFDNLGKMSGQEPDLPKSDYIGSSKESWYIAYANKDSILYKTPMNGVFSILIPSEGDISAFETVVYHSDPYYYTIENNEKSLCLYGPYDDDQKHVVQVGLNLPAKFLRCYTAKDLPASSMDNTVAESAFKFMRQFNNVLYVVTKTSQCWQVYQVSENHDDTNKVFTRKISKFYSFPLSINITAFIPGGGIGSFYIAIENKDIVKYDCFYGFDQTTKKYDTQFKIDGNFYTKGLSRKLDIKDMIYSGFIYAVTGDDKIYRFDAKDGEPDFIIKPLSDN